MEIDKDPTYKLHIERKTHSYSWYHTKEEAKEAALIKLKKNDNIIGCKISNVSFDEVETLIEYMPAGGENDSL